MEKNDFVKIVYFDEPFVADFMQIRAGGELKKTTEFISEITTESEGSGSAECDIGTNKKGLPQLFGFLSGVNISAKASGEIDLSRKKDRIVKNIIENTLLADFIALIEADEKRRKNKRCAGIYVFENMTIRPEVNSFAFFMLIAPFFNMIDGIIPLKTNDGQEMNLDISRIEAAIKAGRGYYEFIASDGTSEKIFRFNQSAFRNNYTMSDLPKMKLTYYAVKVGSISKDDLRVEKEFEFGAMRIPDRAEYSEYVPKEEFKTVDVYDVVLAGVLDNGK